MFVRKGDWLLCCPDLDVQKIDDFSIFALVLEVSGTMVKIARWQGFGRLRISDVQFPLDTIRENYIKVGAFKFDKSVMEDVKIKMKKSLSPEFLDREHDIFEYDKILYSKSSGTRTLETMVKYKNQIKRRKTMEEDILRCLDSVDADSEEAIKLKKSLTKKIEKIYKDSGYVVIRSLDGKLEDLERKGL